MIHNDQKKLYYLLKELLWRQCELSNNSTIPNEFIGFTQSVGKMLSVL